MTNRTAEKTIFLLSQYCNAIMPNHTTIEGMCSSAKLSQEPFLGLASHPLIFETVCQFFDGLLFLKANQGDIVLASCPAEFLLANRVAHRLSAILTQAHSQNLKIATLELSQGHMNQITKDAAPPPLEITAALVDKGKIYPVDLEILDKRIVVVYGFLTREDQKKVEEVRDLIERKGGQLLAELAICLYEFSDGKIQALLEGQTAWVSQEFCPFCHPKPKILLPSHSRP